MEIKGKKRDEDENIWIFSTRETGNAALPDGSNGCSKAKQKK